MLDGGFFAREDALGADPRTRAAALFAAGVDWIQLRDRSLEGEALWRLACELVAARDADPRAHADADTDGEAGGETGGEADGDAAASARARTKRVLVNRRADVAWASGADGVHLGFDALPAERLAELPEPPRLCGGSLHDVEACGRARAAGFDYVHLAPIWDPRSKPAERPALGAERLRAACRQGVPVLAQGGLDAQRAREAVGCGAAGIAVTGIVSQADDPLASVLRLRRALDAARSPSA